MAKANKKAVVKQISIIKPNENLVKCLEELLQEARSGETVGIAYVTLDRENYTSTGFVGVNHRIFNILGGVVWLQARIMDTIRDG